MKCIRMKRLILVYYKQTVPSLFTPPPPVSIEAIKTVSSLFTLPPPVSDFTGREEELEALKTSFKNGAVIIGVSGAGGIGKTELARKLAQEIADDYPEARLQIDLLGTSEHPLTPEEAMRRLLQPFYPDQKLPQPPEQLQGLYRQTFAAHKSLLLLDNAANAAQVRRLIPPAPSAAIVTSRQHFTLTEFGLTPLRLNVLPPAQARQFLRTASPKLKDSPDEKVDELATLCGHLPLALRVAASLLNDNSNWTLETLLARLADERTRLSRLKRDDDSDLDVETAISLSYRLLDDPLKQKFRQLGVFTAPFVTRFAQAVWDLEDETEADDLLGKLTNRSLLSLLPLGEGFTYALHDLTRLFAVNQLQENGEYDQTAMRHADHFLEWAGAADDLYQKGGENILPALSLFRFIYPHLEAAFDRLSKRGGEPAADRWLSDFPGRCAYVLDLHLPPRQRIPLLELALAASRRLSDKEAEGVHLGNLGNAYAALGEARQAIPFYEQRLEIAREIGDRRGEGNALGNLGSAYADLGEKEKARACWQAALGILRAIESPHVKTVETWLAGLEGGE